MESHDHLCLDPSIGSVGCESCMNIATIREDERFRVVGILDSLPPGSDIRTVKAAISPPGNWRDLLRIEEDVCSF